MVQNLDLPAYHSAEDIEIPLGIWNYYDDNEKGDKLVSAPTEQH